MNNLKKEIKSKEQEEKENDQNRIFLNNMLKRMNEEKYI